MRSTEINLLPTNAPPLYESVDSFFKDLLPASTSETTKIEKLLAPELPPPYEDVVRKDAVIIAQNQVTLVHDNPEETIIERIDTEPHLTIRQIREWLRERLNARQVELRYQGRELNNDNDTLADSGWTPGECGIITVHTKK